MIWILKELKFAKREGWRCITVEKMKKKHELSRNGENPFMFQGTPRKMRIVSNGICYGPCPWPDDIVEQRITINSVG